MILINECFRISSSRTSNRSPPVHCNPISNSMAAPDLKELDDRHTPVSNHAELGCELEQPVGDGDKETHRYATGSGIEMDEATDKRLFWKINRRILIIQLITYFCQSLDKGTLNFASIMGIETDAHLSDATNQVSAGRPMSNQSVSTRRHSTAGSARFYTLASWLGSIPRTFCYRSSLWPSFLLPMFFAGAPW